ncbi:hypothetical protein ACFXPV_36350 [Streptomyces sp. NPDC059118]|uniref:hypothetical protein n=1 Tax=unclassified Streptomyces TaxID=2593676 RepID=UPI0036BB6CB2
MEEAPGTGADITDISAISAPKAVRVTPVALDLPGTANALERYQASAGYWAGAGAAGSVVWLLLAVYVGGVFLTVLPGVVGAGAAALLTGGVMRLRSRRMRRVLGTRRWEARASATLPRGMRGAAVVLGGPGAGELLPLRPHTTQSRFPLLAGPAGVLWWCGDARTGGVLAPPGGRELIWARPVRGRRARSVVALPQVGGLRTRPAPQQPQRPVDDVAGPARTAAAPVMAARRRRPWWRGTFRWAVVVGCLLMALATSWSVAFENDPQVDLTVTGESDDGRCLVRWTDPFDGRTRTGPFHCQQLGGTRDATLDGWETGFVVSYGPFKGDLYDSELRGTSAVTLTDIVGLGGLGLTAIGVIGGVTRLVRSARRRREERDAWSYASAGMAGAGTGSSAGSGVGPSSGADTGGPGTGPDTGGPGTGPGEPFGVEVTRASSVTYAALATTAELQARLRGPATAKPRGTGGVRAGQPVTWWRVPMLRWFTGIARASCLLGYTAVIAVLCWVRGADTVPGASRASAVLTGIMGAYFAWRACVTRIPLARRTARAANAPAPRTRRYALLFDVIDAAEGPLLVLFPAEGSEALPEGVLRLIPPGPDKCPWAGLPAPTGTVELRGWLDGAPVVVAWIEGRPYWPLDVYQGVDPSDPEALEALAELLPGPM